MSPLLPTVDSSEMSMFGVGGGGRRLFVHNALPTFYGLRLTGNCWGMIRKENIQEKNVWMELTMQN